MLSIQIATGLGMMIMTIIIHSTFMVYGIKAVRWRVSHYGVAEREMARAVLFSALISWLFLAIVLEASLWALFYLANPSITALPDLETAFYFSMVTFTTLGYGDVLLSGQWCDHLWLDDRPDLLLHPALVQRRWVGYPVFFVQS